MGQMTLLQGDCLELMKDIPDGGVDLLLTDIPYGVVNRESNGLRNLNKGLADVSGFDLVSLCKQMASKTSGSIYVFCGSEQVSAIRKTLVELGFSTRLCIWEKTNPSPMNGQHIWLSGVECCVFGKRRGAIFNEHCKNSVFRFPSGRNKLHPTQKPLPLVQYLVEVSSNPGDVVFDPFMGSGTTGVACVNTERKFIGMELDEEYFEIAKNRIDEAIRKKGELT